jgi:hypothetical protein
VIRRIDCAQQAACISCADPEGQCTNTPSTTEPKLSLPSWVSTVTVSPGRKNPGEDLLRQRVLQLRTDGALQRPGTVDRAEAGLAEQVQCGVADVGGLVAVRSRNASYARSFAKA